MAASFAEERKPPIFRVESVSKVYSHRGREVHALSRVSLSIESGDVYGIIGLSGAGKSTLIRALCGLVTPSDGQVFFHDVDLAGMDKRKLRDFRKRIGMIFQHFNLLTSRTVYENIHYPLEIAGSTSHEAAARVEELLGLVGLQEKKNAYPSQLSGGEKQRVGIARALANHPEVLLCDEATSALDPKTTREILQLLKNINKKLGVTIALITHEMEVIRQICTKVAVIEKGRIVEEGAVVGVFVDPKHSTTKHFLQSRSHEIPPEFFQNISPNRRLLRLKFHGEVARAPVMSEIVRKFNVDANILLGWIDRLQSTSVGTLVVELTGPVGGIEKALDYLEEKTVQYEVIENEL